MLAGWAAGEAVPQWTFMDYVHADFATSVEARRLFWGVGYMMEKNLPDNQLQWLYDGHYMPWDWHYDIARHLWDESRHGDSGYSRLRDFGISLDEIGFPGYDQPDRDAVLAKFAAANGVSVDEAHAREELPKALLRELPNFMCPREIHWRAAMPIGPNGKIDRTAIAGELNA